MVQVNRLVATITLHIRFRLSDMINLINGKDWIRTSEPREEQIYSLSALASCILAHNNRSGSGNQTRDFLNIVRAFYH